MSSYKSYTQEQLEELFSNFLIDSWSYSKVASFSRNEKAFEMQYIYRDNSMKSSSGSIAGKAYHKALENYFKAVQEEGKKPLDIVDMQNIAFDFIDNVEANEWKIMKTTPTVEDCIVKAQKDTNIFIKNFCVESSVYLEDLDEVLGVEQYINEWVTVNGVDIPLPLHGVIDLVVRLKNGKIVIIDHKTKTSYTDEKEQAFVISKQAIAYVLGYEAANENVKVDEVWFVENKASKNKDGGDQIRPIKVVMDHDTRVLYESFLYEPLKRMIEAVSNPDYVYIVNDSDNMQDKAELYEFWSKTMMADIAEFNVQENKKDIIQKRLLKIKDSSRGSITPNIIKNFRRNAASFITYDYSNKDMNNATKIEHVLRTFGLQVQVAHEIKGFSSDTYLIEAGAGVQVKSLYKHKLDIANALNVANVRMSESLVVYEGKSYLVCDINKKREENLAWDSKYLTGHKLPIGQNNFRETLYWDLDNHSTPHCLVCGATGSGKSVSLISTLAYAKAAGVEDIVIFDPKFEFVNVDIDGCQVYSDIEDISYNLQYLVAEMQDRAKTRTSKLKLVIFDEIADAIACDPKIEKHLQMLAQKGRSLGYRILAATQRASVKVITGDTKVNFPIQICFRVPKAVDSKVVLDEEGAETLMGYGDGLIRSPEYLNVERFQGFYKSA